MVNIMPNFLRKFRKNLIKNFKIPNQHKILQNFAEKIFIIQSMVDDRIKYYKVLLTISYLIGNNIYTKPTDILYNIYLFLPMSLKSPLLK